MPEKMTAAMRRDAKEGQFSSISEFVRQLYRDYQEQRVLARLRKSQAEIAEGKGKVLRSLKDLR